jgi:hypothetical protein
LAEKALIILNQTVNNLVKLKTRDIFLYFQQDAGQPIINTLTTDEKSPLRLVFESGHSETVELLSQNGSSGN